VADIAGWPERLFSYLSNFWNNHQHIHRDPACTLHQDQTKNLSKNVKHLAR